jgi:predicted SprT family Zn-dependent metalloprotease
MGKTLARCAPEKARIRLSPAVLQRAPDDLASVLCHEAAHVAVAALHGRQCRPHGPEWAALVRAAGFEPQTSAAVSAAAASARPRRAALVYEHRCPVCQMVRLARRPVAGWRCTACLSLGLDARLEITRRRPAAGE